MGGAQGGAGPKRAQENPKTAPMRTPPLKNKETKQTRKNGGQGAGTISTEPPLVGQGKGLRRGLAPLPASPPCAAAQGAGAIASEPPLGGTRGLAPLPASPPWFPPGTFPSPRPRGLGRPPPLTPHDLLPRSGDKQGRRSETRKAHETGARPGSGKRGTPKGWGRQGGPINKRGGGNGGRPRRARFRAVPRVHSAWPACRAVRAARLTMLCSAVPCCAGHVAVPLGLHPPPWFLCGPQARPELTPTMAPRRRGKTRHEISKTAPRRSKAR